MAVALRNVEDATFASDGSPPITRTTFPTCRAHYPGGSSGCACRLLPALVGAFPKWQEGRHPHCHFRGLHRLHSVTARRIAQPPKVTFVTRLRPSQLPDQAARQLPDLSTIIRVEPSSTDDSRLRGARPQADIGILFCKPWGLLEAAQLRFVGVAKRAPMVRLFGIAQVP